MLNEDESSYDSQQLPKDKCDECGLRAPGGPVELPLVPCWHDNCPGRVHLTCAQLGGWLIATGRYPHGFYVTCKRHVAEYREVRNQLFLFTSYSGKIGDLMLFLFDS